MERRGRRAVRFTAGRSVRLLEVAQQLVDAILLGRRERAHAEAGPGGAASSLAHGDHAIDDLTAIGRVEAGETGQANTDRLQALIARGKLRVLGPSSIGLANLNTGMTLTANAAFAEPDLPVGGLFVASHSGSLIGALMSRGKRKGLGFAGLVSVGGEADLSIGDVCLAALDDPDVTGFLLFLEQRYQRLIYSLD